MTDTPVVEKYEPHIVNRLFWWWFIYLIPPQIALLLYDVFFAHTTPDSYPVTFILVALFFPMGLVPYWPPAGYVFYVGHLIFTCIIERKKWFRIAMIILIVAVVINLAFCAEINRQLSHFHP
jgi:hypothetical protein